MQQGTCLFAGKPQNGAVSGVVRIHAGNEKELLEAVATVGPVAAAVDATSNAFRVRNSVVLLQYYTLYHAQTQAVTLLLRTHCK